jgi:hypothetical protein
MRRNWLAAGAVSAVLLMSGPAAAPEDGSEKAVLLELFTSQG